MRVQGPEESWSRYKLPRNSSLFKSPFCCCFLLCCALMKAGKKMFIPERCIVESDFAHSSHAHIQAAHAAVSFGEVTRDKWQAKRFYNLQPLLVKLWLCNRNFQHVGFLNSPFKLWLYKHTACVQYNLLLLIILCKTLWPEHYCWDICFITGSSLIPCLC